MARNSNTQKTISGIAAAILLIGVAFVVLPSFWFWVAFDILAALSVAIGCTGEWYLHHHPAGRKRRELDEHHKLESRYIASVALGVIMEVLAVGHTIWEGAKLEHEVAVSKKTAGEANRQAGLANQQAEELHKANLELEKQVGELKKSNLALEERIQPRRISPAQREAIAATIKQYWTPYFTNNSDKITVRSDSDNFEGDVLASQISELLTKDCKIIHKVWKPSSVYPSGRPAGLFLVVKDPKQIPEHGAIILSAFRTHAANLNMRLGEDASLGLDEFHIYVAIKPW